MGELYRVLGLVGLVVGGRRSIDLVSGMLGGGSRHTDPPPSMATGRATIAHLGSYLGVARPGCGCAYRANKLCFPVWSLSYSWAVSLVVAGYNRLRTR